MNAAISDRGAQVGLVPPADHAIVGTLATLMAWYPEIRLPGGSTTSPTADHALVHRLLSLLDHARVQSSLKTAMKQACDCLRPIFLERAQE
jgi:hypothetical protein